MSRVCRNPNCGRPIPAETLKKRPDQVYCNNQCHLSDPRFHEHLRQQLMVENLRRKETGIDPAHGGEAARKRGAAIAKSNREKPRRKRKPFSRFVSATLRAEVKVRCCHQCSYCGRQGTSESDPDGKAWHIEHVVPVERGGPTHIENLTLSCRSCNLRKGIRPAYRFALTLSML